MPISSARSASVTSVGGAMRIPVDKREILLEAIVEVIDTYDTTDEYVYASNAMADLIDLLHTARNRGK
jgi:hypothetical protein